jgi:hypothetical protein
MHTFLQTMIDWLLRWGLHIALLWVGNYAVAQHNLPLALGAQHDALGHRYAPSQLDLGPRTVQLGMGYNLWVGNRALDYGYLRRIYRSSQISQEQVNQLLGNLDEENKLGVGQDTDLLQAAFQVRLTNDQALSFSLGVSNRFALNFVYPRSLMELGWRGNRPFAGQAVPLGPTRLLVNYQMEYSLGTAVPLWGSPDAFGMRLGLRGRYIQGLASIYAPEANGTFYTAPDGRHIDLQFDYAVHTSGLADFDLLASNGRGWGLDAGLTTWLTENFEFTASVLDVGRVRYTQNLRAFAQAQDVRYEGLVVGTLFGDDRLLEDSLAYIFRPDSALTDKAFGQPLGARLAFQAAWKRPAQSRRGTHYNADAVFLHIVQGLSDAGFSSRRPYVGLAYYHNFGNVVLMGLNAGWGGWTGWAVGPFLSFNATDRFRFTLGAGNLNALVVPDRATGLDISFGMSVGF